MGFKTAWVGVRDVAPEVIHEVFGLRSLGHEEEDDVIDDDVYGVALPGWYVIVANTSVRAENPYYFEEMPLGRVTADGGVAVGCFVHETVMHSGGAGWKGGEQQWSVCHMGDQAVDDLTVEGAPPEPFAEIERRQRERQEGVTNVDHIFDIPVALAGALVGFFHDKTPRKAQDFERLERI